MVLIFVTILIVFAAVWIGFHIAKSITVPIEKLAQATKEVSKGNLSVRVEDPVSDELGMLIDSFNQMIADLKDGPGEHRPENGRAGGPQAVHRDDPELDQHRRPGPRRRRPIAAINPAARTSSPCPANVVGRPALQDVLGARATKTSSAIEASMQTRHQLAEKEIRSSSTGSRRPSP